MDIFLAQTYASHSIIFFFHNKSTNDIFSRDFSFVVVGYASSY